MVDRQIVMVAPFAPRAEIVPHPWIACEPQRDISVGGAVTALAIGHDFVFWPQPERLKFCPQLGWGLEAAVSADVMDPVAMNSTGNRAAVMSPYALAVVFLVSAHVEDLDSGG